MRVALAVHAHGSVTAAAETLCISAAAVSKTIAEVEAALGIDLFQREGRRVVITEAGRHFVRSGRAIVSELRVLEEEMAFIANGNAGSINIGFATHQAKSYLATAIMALKAQYPRVLIRLIDLEPSDILAYLREGRLDLAVGNIDALSAADDLDGIGILEIEHVLVASANHPLAGLSKVEWEDVLAHIWCLPSLSHPLRQAFNNACSRLHLATPQNLIETTALLSMPILFQKMPLIGIAPKEIAQDWCRSGHVSILPVVLPLRSPPQAVIWSRNLPLSRTSKHFIELVRENRLPQE